MIGTALAVITYVDARSLARSLLAIVATRQEAPAMATDTKTYTIIFSEGNFTQTVKTGLSLEEARAWLAKKAAETGHRVSVDLTVEQDGHAGGGAWTAVPAE
jgi:hypothetical protein